MIVANRIRKDNTCRDKTVAAVVELVVGELAH